MKVKILFLKSIALSWYVCSKNHQSYRDLMFKSFVLLYLSLTLVTSLEAGYEAATLVIKRENPTISTKSDVFHLKPMSYASIYPSTGKQLVKIIRVLGNDGCQPFQKVDPEENLLVFYLVDGKQGLCTFNKRANNAKKSSANGIIIVTYKYAFNNFNLISSKDYFQIFLLPEDQGPLILVENSPFLAQVNIKKSNETIASAQIWISSLNQKSYDVVGWWAANLKKIPNLYQKVSWQPRFAYISCKSITSVNNSCGGYISSCACGGVFCSPEKHGESSNVLVREDIRQQLVFKESAEKFVAYMNEFKQRCLQNYISKYFVQDCANSLLTHLQIDSAVLNQKIDKMLDSCQKPTFSLESQFKIYQQMILDQGKFRQINNYPTITLNHQILSIKNEKQLKYELCRKLAMEKEEGCFVQQQTNITQYSNGWSTLLWTVLIVLLIVVVIFAILKFKNKLRHQMNKELKMQVSTAVEHYFTLAQTNASK